MARADWRRARIALVVAVLAASACGDRVELVNHVAPTEPTTPTAPRPRRVVGVAEVTFRNVTAATITADIRMATTVAGLEQLRASPTATGDVVAVQLSRVVTGMFEHTPAGGEATRFIRATFGLRNARGDSGLFDAARENLSFVPLRTAATIGTTPFRLLERVDRGAVAEALARRIAPSALLAIDAEGNLVTLANDVLDVVTSDDIEKTDSVVGASGLLPYRFVVRRPPGSAAPGFDGFVTFAYRLPLLPVERENLAAISVLFLMVNDTAAPRAP